jgi:hypothetical protein
MINELKIKNLRIISTYLFAYLLICLFAVQPARAQEVQRTYTIVNPQIEVKLNPGQSSEGTTKVINQTDVPLTFNLAVQDFVVTDTTGTPDLLPANTLASKYSAASWIAVSPSTFTVQPGQKQIVNYYIQVPGNASPGGHYAAITYSPLSPSQNVTGGTVKTQVGSLFYITVNGQVNEQATVSKFLANSFYEYGPAKIATQIKNLGDLHITPQGTISLSGPFVNQSVKLASYNIFPGAARDYANTLGQNLMIGRYKVTLIASYGTNGNLPLVATLYFWVFPWRIALVIGLAIVALILGGLYLKKRRKDNFEKPEEPKVEPTTPPEVE